MKLRLVSYNVHKCIGGLDRRYSPERIRDAIAPHEPDFVMLQEVDDGVARTQRHRQAELLGDLLGLRHRTFFPNVPVRKGGHYGNAILSRFPILEARNIDVSLPFTKQRSVLYARIRVRPLGPGKNPRTLVLFNLHLGLSQFLRERQLLKFVNSPPFRATHYRTPVVLAGDLNDVWGVLGARFLFPVGFRGPGHTPSTFPAWAPIRALDGVYVRGDAELVRLVRPVNAVTKRASDHLPLVAEIRLR